MPSKLSRHTRFGPTYPAPTRIRKERLSAGLTQADAAGLLGVSERAWQDWEGGRRRMRMAFFELFQTKVSGTSAKA